MSKLKIANIGWANSIHIERMMLWFAKKGHDISIITDHPKEISGIKVYDIRRKPDLRPRLERYKDFYFNIPWKWLFKFNEIVRIRKLVEEISPDIIHSHSLWYPGYLGVYIKGYPFILTVLNGDILWKKDDINFYIRLRTRWGIRKADLITGVSDELVKACVKQGADKNKVHVIRRGVDLSRFNCNGNREEIRHKLGLPKDYKIILSPRNTALFYNLDKIVKAIPKVISQVENVYFIFIWHGHNSNKEKELKNLASKLGVLNAVKIVGYVTHDMVSLYHKASDLMVSVSQYDSGPVALQEAMACGNVPVISNLSCVREWIKHDWNGLMVNPNNINEIADSIIELLKNDKKRKTFAERNWDLIKEKGDENYWMGKLEEMYFSLLN